jgi:hypothetical protein
VSGMFNQECIRVGKMRETCPKVGGVGWGRPRAFGVLRNTLETFEVALKCSELNIEVQRRPRMFRVCLWEYEHWLYLYKASCNVFSELGPVGGPITSSVSIAYHLLNFTLQSQVSHDLLQVLQPV